MLDETIIILGVALVLAGLCIFWLAFSLYDTQQRLASLEGYVGAQFSILDARVRQILEASTSQAPQPTRHERRGLRPGINSPFFDK